MVSSARDTLEVPFGNSWSVILVFFSHSLSLCSQIFFSNPTGLAAFRVAQYFVLKWPTVRKAANVCQTRVYYRSLYYRCGTSQRLSVIEIDACV